MAWRRNDYNDDSGVALLASGSADKTARIWTANIGIKSEGTGLPLDLLNCWHALLFLIIT